MRALLVLALPRAIVIAVALLLGCGGAPTLREEIPMVESWASHAQILLFGIPAPHPLEVDQAYSLRISLLHRPTELRYTPMGRSMLEPIAPGVVRDIAWTRPIVSSVRVNLERFMAEGIVGLAPMTAEGDLMHIHYCPPDMLRAGYVTNPDDRDIVRLRVEPDWHTDPEYGCLYHLSP